jgi:membrane protein
MPQAQAAPDVDRSRWHRVLPTARYLMSTDVHTYAFSVAANAILSFFPFVVLLLTITRKVLRSPAMTAIVLDLLRDYLPVSQEFVIRNLQVLVSARKGAQIASFIMLLITSTGVFLPLEVALNKVWGFPKNRSYLLNQLVSLGLAFAGGVLALLSVALAAGNQHLMGVLLLGSHGIVFRGVGWIVMKAIAIVASILIFFLIYWLLPNGHVPARAVFPAAVVTGLLWEVAKYGYILALPWLNFQEVYGPFSISVTLMFWAFLSGLLLLGGAYLSAEAPDSPRSHEDAKAD